MKLTEIRKPKKPAAEWTERLTNELNDFFQGYGFKVKLVATSRASKLKDWTFRLDVTFPKGEDLLSTDISIAHIASSFVKFLDKQAQRGHYVTIITRFAHWSSPYPNDIIHVQPGFDTNLTIKRVLQLLKLRHKDTDTGVSLFFTLDERS